MSVAAHHIGYTTENADTAITALVPSLGDDIPRVSQIIYRVAGTAHTLTLLRPVAGTTVSASAAAAQKDIVLTSMSPGNDSSGDAEDLAASDYIAWRDENGVIQYDIIASVDSATKTVTMTSNLPTAVSENAQVWAFYEVGRSSHFVMSPATSSTLSLSSSAGVMQAGISLDVDRHNTRSGQGDPLLFHSTNATAAGFLDLLSVEYV